MAKKKKRVMDHCTQCNEWTSIICPGCGMPFCERHVSACERCGKMFCRHCLHVTGVCWPCRERNVAEEKD